MVLIANQFLQCIVFSVVVCNFVCSICNNFIACSLIYNAYVHDAILGSVVSH